MKLVKDNFSTYAKEKTRDNSIIEVFHPDSRIIGAVLDYNKDDKCADQVLCMDIIMGERCWRWRPNKRLTHSHLSCSGHGSATGGVKTNFPTLHWIKIK